jgi:hypothetical protein
MKPCVRLNGSSDLRWDFIFPALFTEFYTVQFYDYTKNKSAMSSFLLDGAPLNYHLTYSCSGSVAIVTRSTNTLFLGFPTVDGDETDLRFLDGRSKWIRLIPKGKARYQKDSSFVVNFAEFETVTIS